MSACVQHPHELPAGGRAVHRVHLVDLPDIQHGAQAVRTRRAQLHPRHGAQPDLRHRVAGLLRHQPIVDQPAEAARGIRILQAVVSNNRLLLVVPPGVLGNRQQPLDFRVTVLTRTRRRRVEKTRHAVELRRTAAQHLRIRPDALALPLAGAHQHGLVHSTSAEAAVLRSAPDPGAPSSAASSTRSPLPARVDSVSHS